MHLHSVTLMMNKRQWKMQCRNIQKYKLYGIDVCSRTRGETNKYETV